MANTTHIVQANHLLPKKHFMLLTQNFFAVLVFKEAKSATGGAVRREQAKSSKVAPQVHIRGLPTTCTPTHSLVVAR